MLRQLSSGLAMGLMLVAARHGGAQEMEVPAPEAVPPPAVIRVSPGYTLPYQRGCSLKRICQWLTYRPLPQPVPVCCQGPRCQTSALPPLYLYFIGEFGPRSPELAHMTGGFAAGGTDDIRGGRWCTAGSHLVQSRSCGEPPADHHQTRGAAPAHRGQAGHGKTRHKTGDHGRSAKAANPHGQAPAKTGDRRAKTGCVHPCGRTRGHCAGFRYSGPAKVG